MWWALANIHILMCTCLLSVWVEVRMDGMRYGLWIGSLVIQRILSIHWLQKSKFVPVSLPLQTVMGVVKKLIL